MPDPSPDSMSPTLRLHAPDPDADPTAPGSNLPARRATSEAIDAYWNEVEGRVGYVIALLEVERYAETLTLCATYLDSIAHALVTTNPRAGESGAESAAEEDDPYLGLIHPQQLSRLVTQLPGISAATTTGFSLLIESSEPQLLYRDQAMDLIRSTLPLSEAVLVERVLWKCTVAYIIYDFLRSQSYRRREGSRTIGLGTAFYEGEMVRGLSVPELVALLRGLIDEARARSHATGRLPEPA
jgi:hypothetical protein